MQLRRQVARGSKPESGHGGRDWLRRARKRPEQGRRPVHFDRGNRLRAANTGDRRWVSSILRSSLHGASTHSGSSARRAQCNCAVRAGPREDGTIDLIGPRGQPGG